MSKKYQPLDAMTYPRFEGVRTFMRLPLVTDVDALKDVDIAIAGVPFDTGATYRVGARFGPSGIRHESVLLRPYHPFLKVNVAETCSCIDYGDLPIVPGYLPESHQQIRQAAKTLVDSPATPIFLGGDHSVSLPLLRAVAEKYGSVALVHFDAHSDLWEGYFGGKDTHGTPFRRAVEEGLIDPSHSIQVGLRGSLYGEEDFVLPETLGLEMIAAPEAHAIGVQEIVRRIKARAADKPAYLTFDIDVVDPTFAPGTGTPEVGGFDSYTCQALLRGLTGINFVAYDLVEVMPTYDPAHITSLLAANLVYEMMALEALSRQG